MLVHFVTKKEIKSSVQAVLVEMQPFAPTSLFELLSALLEAVSGSTATLHSPHGFTHSFEKQTKEKESIRFLKVVSQYRILSADL